MEGGLTANLFKFKWIRTPFLFLPPDPLWSYTASDHHILTILCDFVSITTNAIVPCKPCLRFLEWKGCGQVGVSTLKKKSRLI